MYSLSQIESALVHLIKTNTLLQASGKIPIALEIIGESGVGKTSLVEQIAERHDFNFVKRNLAQMDELGELIGFPIREFEMKDGRWINEKQLENSKEDFDLTGRARTTSCPPDWVPTDDNGKGGILLLDDYSRAQPRFLQATMELVSRGEYDRWKLPPGWTIVLTSNPDNGEYSVSGLDRAQKTRYISLTAKFSVKEWAQWAEDNRIDSRCINFVLLNEECITEETNARIVTEFFNSISSLPDFSSVGNLQIIEMLGHGSVTQEFTALFVTFVNNKLDRLPSPEDIFNKPQNEIGPRLSELIKTDGEDYNNSIASVIAQRIINYTRYFIRENKRLPNKMKERIIYLIKGEFFAGDIKMFLIKELSSYKQLETLLLDEEISASV